MKRKPTLNELSEQLKSLNKEHEPEQVIDLATKLQHNIQLVLSAKIARLPSRARNYAWGYGRQSKDEQVQAHTRTVQETQILEYHAKHLSHLEFRGTFFDIDVSGGVPLFRRDAGNAINTHLRRGDHLIITKLDRAFRSKYDGYATIKSLDQRGIIVHIINMGIDMSTPNGRLMFAMALTIAEWEREMIGVRTSEGLAVYKASGRLLGDPRRSHIGWKREGHGKYARLVEDHADRAQCDEVAKLLETMSYQEFEYWAMKHQYRHRYGGVWTRDRAYWAMRARELNYPQINQKKGISALRRQASRDKIKEYMEAAQTGRQLRKARLEARRKEDVA